MDEAPVAARIMPSILLLRTVSISVLATVVNETRVNRLAAVISFIPSAITGVEGNVLGTIYTLAQYGMDHSVG